MKYDHFIAVDWAQRNMAISRISGGGSEKASIVDVAANIGELKLYLKQLKGRKILTFEETTTSQWLYTELREYVDEVIVCDPQRNRLLSEGAKTDKIDALKLSQLLKAGLLKGVYHSGEQFIELRKFVSSYGDLIQAGVRVKNQRSALFRAVGKNHKEADPLTSPIEEFILKGMDQTIKNYEEERERYQRQFHAFAKKEKLIQALASIPGIGEIGAVKIVAIVVDPMRFKCKGDFWSYCGLAKLQKISGGRSYGLRSPKYNRVLKSVFKSAALAVLMKGRENRFKDYYLKKIQEKNYPEFRARHAVARKIASIALGVMKTKRPFYELEENKEERQIA